MPVAQQAAACGDHTFRPRGDASTGFRTPRRGPAGDALITVNVAPHPLFKPDGADLRLELPITLYEAVLGGKVRVPTLDGALELTIPPGTDSGRTFRLKGKGLPVLRGRDRGDQLVRVHVQTPERLSRTAKELLEKLAHEGI